MDNLLRRLIMSELNETKISHSGYDNSVGQSIKNSSLSSFLFAVSSNTATSFTCSQDDFDQLMARLSDEQKKSIQFTSTNGFVHVNVSPSANDKQDNPEKKSPSKKEEKYSRESEEKMDDQLDKKRKEKKKNNKKNKKLTQKKTAKIKNEAAQRASKMDKFLGRSKKLSSVKEAVARIGQKKLLGKSSTKVLAKSAAKSTAKATSKILGKAALKSLVKKIPVISLAAGCVFAYQRVKDGDWKGAIGEVTSGALGCVPGIGTAASVAVDAGLAARDVYNENKTISQENMDDVHSVKIVPQQIRDEIDRRGIPEKSSVRHADASLSPNQVSLLQKFSENSR